MGNVKTPDAEDRASVSFAKEHTMTATAKIKLIAIVFLFLLSSIGARAINTYIDPADINFRSAIPGAYGEKSLKITTDSERSMSFHVSAEGDIKEWVNFSPGSDLAISSKAPLFLKIGIKVPENARAGSYEGSLLMYFQEQDDISNNEGVFDMKLLVNVLDEPVEKIDVKDVYAADAEKNREAYFFTVIENSGSMSAKPMINVSVQESAKAVEELLLPMEEKEAVVSIDTTNLEPGRHSARVAITLEDKLISDNIVGFSIVEGPLIKRGSLLGMVSRERFFIGDTVRIDAAFRNTGRSAFKAGFKGSIYFNDTKVAEIESDEAYSAPNKTILLPLYFKPDETGDYKITGQVIYGETATDEQAMIVNIAPESERSVVQLEFGYIEILIMVVVLLVIVDLVATKKLRDARRENGP